MDVTAWRRAKRTELYAARKAMTARERKEAARKIAAELERWCTRHTPTRIGLYWPIRYEPNLLDWARHWAERLAFCLPVIIARGQPLEYWRWTPGDPLQSAVWGIQIPARRQLVSPDLVVAPLVGFDQARYRLGNGGGYFDRTLAAMTNRPFAIGVGYANAELETIHPQPHDIPMDAIVTERS